MIKQEDINILRNKKIENSKLIYWQQADPSPIRREY